MTIIQKPRKIAMKYGNWVGTDKPAELKTQKFKSISSAAYSLDMSRVTIHNVCSGRQKHAKYNGAWVTFEYIDEE